MPRYQIRRSILFCLVLFIGGAAFSSDDRLAAAARDPMWLRLLHFRKGIFGGEKSAIVTKEFFVSPRGRTDPLAELKAELDAFKNAPADSNESLSCRFPARRDYLVSRGLLDAIDAPACSRFESWKEKLAPKSVSLIFASYYFNNPASMFGHTFLTLNRGLTTDPTHTLDYTVNYAAITNSRSGLQFAIKGLGGGYQGRFSTDPYYVKIQQYTNLESRDLWEYELKLSPEQIDRLMKHLWELGPAAMPYFFLNRNCSYQLLPLLEVADPTLNMSGPFVFRAIPVDTLRAVLAQPNRVNAIRFRPSHRQHMLTNRAQLSISEQRIAYDLALHGWRPAEKNLEVLSEGRQSLVLDTAYDLWRLRSGFRRPLPEKASAREQLILAARNKRPVSPELNVPRPPAPELAHATGRLSLSIGTDRHAQFALIESRPALHDLVNPTAGYPTGTELEMFRPAVRLNNEGAPVSLERFTLIGIKSFPNYDRWVRPPSWRMETGLKVAKDLNKKPGSAGVYNLDGGSGLTFASDRERLRWYSLWEAGAQTGPVFKTGYRVGLGGRTGLNWIAHRAWRLNASAAFRRYGFGDDSSVTTLDFEQAVSLSDGWEWRASANRENHAHEFTTGLFWYF